MKLSELFAEMPEVTIAGVKYTVIFNTRAMMQLEKEFPAKEVNGETISTQKQVAKVLGSAATTGMKALDIVSMLYAGLSHTKQFPSKEALIDLTLPSDWDSYANAIVEGYLKVSMTEEQQEQLKVLAAQSGVKKKEPETTPATTLSTE